MENCFLWCSLFWLVCWQNFPVRHADSGAFWGVCSTGFHLLSLCFEIFGVSFEDQDELGLSPCLMDKYLCEHIQIYLVRDDLLCLRVVTRFHATCEWFGPGWTVVPSPLVHVVRRQPETNRETCRGSPEVWILEKWVSVTLAKCALLLESLDLAHDMFCKLHRCFEEIFVRSLGEAGEWVFLDFMSLLYDLFEASFLIVQAYLMSAMITPVFLVPDNDVLLVPFLVIFTMVKCALVLVFLVLGHGSCCKYYLFLGASGCHAFSRIRFAVHSRCFPLIGCLVPGLDIASES